MAVRKSKAGGLGKYEGREIVSTGIKIRKTGDGLSEAMKVEPKVMHHGDKVYVVLECDVVDVQHPVEDRKSPERGGVNRIHILDAGTATFMEEDVVIRAIEDQEEKNRRWQEQQAGVRRLEDTKLIQAHDNGEHAGGLVEYCPRCEEERDLAEAGK